MGLRVEISYSGDRGYLVSIPDPSQESCAECNSKHHWLLKNVESFSVADTTFEFVCNNLITEDDETTACFGAVTIKRSFR